MLCAIGGGAIENRRDQQALAGAGGIQRGDGVGIGQKRAGGNGQFLHFRFAVTRHTAAIRAKFRLTHNAAADYALRHLCQAETERPAIHRFQGGVVRTCLKFGAFAVAQRHGEALARGPTFAGINQFKEHRARDIDNACILPRAIQRQGIDAAMGGECACREWRQRRGGGRVFRPLG